MHRPFFNAGTEPEPSARLAFSGNRIDRRSEHRAEDCLEQALGDRATRGYGLLHGKLLYRESERQTLFGLAELEELQPDRGHTILLGYGRDGMARLAVPLGADADSLPAGLAAMPPRAVYTQALAGTEGLGEIAQATALLNWSLSAQFCGVCGSRTVSEAGGYRRRCSAKTGGCGSLIFPRTDPVVIMLVIDSARDRCLLGRSPHFPAGFYSCLAGFLEPGETMEDAVRRETLEESGIAVGRVAYHASQPWPIPHSVMTGFYAEALSFAIELDRQELEDCRWFSRKEAARLIERHPDELTTAPDGTIANRLLRDWVGSGANGF